MTINPYSLPNPSDHERYFTDDITLLPLGIIWQSMRGQPIIVRALVFVYFVIRKLLRQRMPASYGTRYPPQLIAISNEELPEDANQALAPFDAACEAAGMQHLGHFRPSWIGRKRGVLSIWIDPGRTMWCGTTWFEIQIGEQREPRAVFYCHSETADDIELDTAIETADLWIPQLIPPHVELERVPSGSTVAEIITHHKQKIANRTDLVTFDPSTIIAHIEQMGRRQIEFMQSKGFYAELSPEEIDRLQPAS